MNFESDHATTVACIMPTSRVPKLTLTFDAKSILIPPLITNNLQVKIESNWAQTVYVHKFLYTECLTLALNFDPMTQNQ